MKQFYKLVEDLDIRPDPSLFDRTKLSWYKEPRKVEKLFPGSEPNKPRYMETITGDSYKKAVANVRKYVGLTPGGVMSLMRAIMEVMPAISQKQAPHLKELEKAAVDTVLQLPEFQMFKDLIASDMLKIDAKLLTPSLKKVKPVEPEEPEIEEIMADELADLDERALRRQFARMMTQGNATNKLYLYELTKETLDKIDPSLAKSYGVLSSVVQTSYYATPPFLVHGAGEEPEEEDPDEVETDEQKAEREREDEQIRERLQAAAVGSVQVIPRGEGKYTIRARSLFFPYLIHEVVKGLYEYLSMDIGTDEQLSKETLGQEMIEIMSGPQLYTNFQKAVPSNKQHLLPLIYKMLLREPIENMRAVLQGGSRGAQIINDLASKAEQTMQDFKSEPEEPYTDTGENDGEGPEETDEIK